MPTLKKSAFLDTISFLDPAGGKPSADRKKANSAIVTVSQDAVSRIFVRHVWAEKVKTEDILEEVIRINNRFRPSVFGIESASQQHLFVDSAILYCKERKEKVPIKHVPQSTREDKIFRIRTIIQPILRERRLFLPRDEKGLLDEMTDFPMSTLVDRVDALASAINLLPKRMSIDPKADEKAAHLTYLRETGAPPSYIEQVARRQSSTPYTPPEDIAKFVRSHLQG